MQFCPAITDQDDVRERGLIMTSPQNLDATFCLLASLISKHFSNPAQLKRDLEAGARHFASSNAELSNLLQRMADAVKATEGLSVREISANADRAVGQALGQQALLFAIVRSMDNANEVFANFQSEIESARASLMDVAARDEARAGLDAVHVAVNTLQKEL